MKSYKKRMSIVLAFETNVGPEPSVRSVQLKIVLNKKITHKLYHNHNAGVDPMFAKVLCLKFIEKRCDTADVFTICK